VEAAPTASGRSTSSPPPEVEWIEAVHTAPGLSTSSPPPEVEWIEAVHTAPGHSTSTVHRCSGADRPRPARARQAADMTTASPPNQDRPALEDAPLEGAPGEHAPGEDPQPDLVRLVRCAATRDDPSPALRALADSHPARVLLHHLAAQQDAQYAVAQARALGLGSHAIRWLIESGRATRVAVGVARFAGAAGPPDPAVTAFLRCWPDATIGYASAAHHHGLAASAPPAPELVVAHGRRRVPPGVVVHQSRSLPRGDRLFDGAVAYTSLARTVCDLASLADRSGTLTRVDDAVAAGASPGWLHQRASALTNGRDGVALVRDATTPASASAFRSWLERVTALLVLLAGLPPAAWNVPVHDRHGLIGIVDALWAAWRVIVEVEGLRFHTTPDARRRDAARFNRLLAAGYRVRRFTWQDVVERPYETAVAIAEALREAGAPVDPGTIPTDLTLPAG
jgi:hypothetical protein